MDRRKKLSKEVDSRPPKNLIKPPSSHLIYQPLLSHFVVIPNGTVAVHPNPKHNPTQAPIKDGGR